jgi:NAD(P)-dependent dehydrogenase (short-subunit alcohol dehydrogenase family)
MRWPEPRGGPLLGGQRVLITGGSGGIGRGICEVAAREGARVAFTWSSHEAGAKETAEQIRAAGGEALALRADLRVRDEAARVVAEVEKAFGGIDLLVNNAGVSESVPYILLDDGEIDDVLEVNLLAAMRLARCAARPMIRQKRGRVVNVSSIAGSRCIPGPVHYATSKGALEGFTRSLAHELGPYGILVNAVAAGIFHGGLLSAIPEVHQRRYLDSCALSRFGEPQECGELVCWLGSPRNTYVNGTVIYQDGGTLG